MQISQKLSTLAMALFLGFSSASMAMGENVPMSASTNEPVQQTTTPTKPATEQSVSHQFGLPDFTPIVEATENGVVNIRTEAPVRSRQSRRGGDFEGFTPGSPDDLFRFFFGPDFFEPAPRSQPRREAPDNRSERTVPSGVGSGFVISEDGYIITNEHVVDGASKVIVTLNDNKEYTAKVIGVDKRTDLALLKIEAKGLKALEMGNSETLKKGQWVLAIGSPYGLESTVTSGIVSAINRDTGDYLPFIQTDVAINPGNSGGPLIDLSGKVIGVNSQIYTRSGGFMGISFSIPISEAMKVVEQLKDKGTVERGRIGVMISAVEKEVADALGLKDTKGALVSNVELNSPAEKAGVRSGDVILSFDGKTVTKWNDLPRFVGLTKPGTTSEMEVWRRGKSETLKITLESSGTGKTIANNVEANSPTVADRLGLSVMDLSKETQEKLRAPNGVEVSEVSGAAAEVGLREGDVIMVINDTDIRSVKEYQDIVEKLPKNRAAALLIRRENLTQWVAVTPSK